MTRSSTNITWETLEMSYKGITKVNIVKLKNATRDFETLEMKELEDIDSFMNQVSTFIN